MLQDPTILTPGASGPSPPTHQGLSLLDFLSPGSPALPHHLDRWSHSVSGGLKGEKTALPSTKMWRATQPLNGNLLALVTIPCFI